MTNIKHIKLSPTWTKLRNIAVVAAIIAGFLISANMLDLNIAKFLSRVQNSKTVLPRFLAFDIAFLPEAILEMLSSVAMAGSALFLGFILSIALSFLAASNTAPNKFLAALIKGAVAVIRAVPALVWILLIVVSIGFGNTSGVVGMMFPTCGYLIKSFAASIEERGTDCIEAMRSVGSGWLGIVIKGVLPGAILPMLSWSSIRLEHNIAESINLGMVGVGGIGSLLMRAIGSYNYGRISVIIVTIFGVMLLTEVAVNAFKRKLDNNAI